MSALCAFAVMHQVYLRYAPGASPLCTRCISVMYQVYSSNALCALYQGIYQSR
jgi:hypothetical protein